MSSITRSNIQNLLLPTLDTVFFDYNRYPDLWKEIFKVHKADRAVEYDMEARGLGLGQLKQDGSPVSMSDFGQVFQTAYKMQYYGIGFQITRAAIMDNLYEREFPQQAKQLRNSLQVLKNINSMFIFNNAFDAASTVSDGQPMCSTQHPTSVGTLQNTFSNGVQFNEAAIEDAITIIKSWTDYAGLNINLNTHKVLVPQARGFDAARIFKSEYQTNTANNNINAIVHDKYMPGGYTINQFITNPNSWFILTDCDNSFKYFLRESLDIDFLTDIITDNVTVRAVERYAFGTSNWRGVFGSAGL